MTNWDNRINRIGAAAFRILALGSLVGALFFGATHQLAIAVIAMVMAFAIEREISNEEAKEIK